MKIDKIEKYLQGLHPIHVKTMDGFYALLNKLSKSNFLTKVGNASL